MYCNDVAYSNRVPVVLNLLCESIKGTKLYLTNWTNDPIIFFSNLYLFYSEMNKMSTFGVNNVACWLVEVGQIGMKFGQEFKKNPKSQLVWEIYWWPQNIVFCFWIKKNKSAELFGKGLGLGGAVSLFRPKMGLAPLLFPSSHFWGICHLSVPWILFEDILNQHVKTSHSN